MYPTLYHGYMCFYMHIQVISEPEYAHVFCLSFRGYIAMVEAYCRQTGQVKIPGLEL